jgi:hypothetical protein
VEREDAISNVCIIHVSRARRMLITVSKIKITGKGKKTGRDKWNF